MKKKLELPLTEETVRSLRIGDEVLLTGTIYTARDAAHKFLTAHPDKCPVSLEGTAIYHCGPIVIGKEGNWRITAAGPTTSTRTEPYIADMVKHFGIRVFIGKGGLGGKSLEAFCDYGCVYLSAVGGCAQVLARAVKKVRNVYFYEEFGSPEAVWELEVEDFPATVTMDSTGETMH